MKKNIYLFAAAMAIALTGCSDDELTEGRGIPVETGDEIMFGSTLNGDQNVVGRGIETRTIYGERTETGIPVYWNNNEPYDKVAIFCPQASAPANHLVDYEIVPSKENQSASAQVIKVNPNEAGLQWGEAEEHKFFGIYPASIVKATDEDDQAGLITATLPTTQQPTGWRIKNDPISKRRVFFGEPNMDYAAMFAYTKVKKSDMAKDKTINLKFQNLITVLDISIPGPESGTVTVTNVNVDVTEGNKRAICGDFNISIQDADINQGHVTCLPSGDPNKVYDRISIPCYDNDTKKFITLGPDDVINVKAFIIPDDRYNQQEGAQEIVRKFRITVAMLNGSAKRVTIDNVKPSTPGETEDHIQTKIVPHKINRILMPPIEAGEPDKWMGNLDPNIYLTELSIPGSKMSYATSNNNASIVYQNKTIEEQFKTGIRAFNVQVGATAKFNFLGNKIEKWTGMPEYYTKKDLKETISAIGTQLKGTKECAVLLLTCRGDIVSTNVFHPNFYTNWMQCIESYLQELAKDQNTYPIYTKEITANTTLGDVKGQIIIKVNYNDTKQEGVITAGAVVPALFGIWKTPTDKELAPISDLRWGTPNTGSTRAKMQWMCQEANSVGAGAEISVANKKKAIQYIFERGVTEYEGNEQHDMWFMNDLGGYYTDQGNSTTELAKDMNAAAIETLQKRTQNASTGLVFMNYADRDKGSGAEYKSDYLIATIIDNNFKFALRKRAGGSGSN